jgi:polygalacturonase
MRRLALALLLLLALPAQAQQWRNYKYLQVENLRLKGSPAFDVRAYGALCDGTTDDATAINLATTAANTAGGGIVLVPKGTCMASDDINIPQNVWLHGVGMFSSIIKRTSSTQGAIGEGGLIHFGTTSQTGSWNAGISDLTVDGNGVNNNTTDQTTANIYGRRKADIVVERVRSINATRTCIHFDSLTTATYTTNITIRDSFADDCGQLGIVLANAQYSTIGNNYVTQTASSGISVGRGSGLSGATDLSSYIRVESNTVNRSESPTSAYWNIASGFTGSQTGNGFLLNIRYTTDSTVVDNIFWDNRLTDTGVSSESGQDGLGSLPHDTKRITITGNVVGYSGGFGIDIPDDSTISNNVVYKPGTHGIVWAGSDTVPATAMQGFVLENNIIIDPNETTHDSDIDGIRITNDGSAETQTMEYAIIRGNSVRDTRGTKRTENALNIGANSTDYIARLVIEENDLADVSTKSIMWSGTPASAFTAIRIRENITRSDDLYRGEATLVAGTVSVQNTNWPAIAGLRFSISRTDVVTTSHALGVIEGKWNGTNTLVLTSRKVADALTETNDVSKVFWEFLGTAN